MKSAADAWQLQLLLLEMGRGGDEIEYNRLANEVRTRHQMEHYEFCTELYTI